MNLRVPWPTVLVILSPAMWPGERGCEYSQSMGMVDLDLIAFISSGPAFLEKLD